MKEKKQEVRLEATSEKTKADTVVWIDEIKMIVQNKGKEPMVIDKSATSSAPPIQKPLLPIIMRLAAARWWTSTINPVGVQRG